MRLLPFYCLSICLIGSCHCSTGQQKKPDSRTIANTREETLPAPYETKSSVKLSQVIGWPEGRTPTVPDGFTISKFADGFDNPRWIYIGPNGDIFISEANTEASGFKKIAGAISGRNKSQKLGNSANRISLLRDTDGDGVPETRTVFLQGLNQPFGMAIIGNSFYVGNTDAVMKFPYTPGQTTITAAGKKILDLPAGGYNNHWTRNLLVSRDGKKLFVTVGSGSNVGEHGMDNEIRRACILEINPDGSGERIYAGGLRNPVGLAYAPGTQTLWTCVNERDELGDDLVPDFFTSVKPGGFYGWPYCYWGQHPDPRLEGQGTALIKTAIVPDVSLGAHTASLGLTFDERGIFPGRYKGGAFIGQHGSWNRSQFAGYRVAFVPFKDGRPEGPQENFLGGFITGEGNKVYGRPVGVAFTQNALLVADDAANTIWRVSVNK